MAEETEEGAGEAGGPEAEQLDRYLRNRLVGMGADSVDSIIAEGVEKSMTKFNRRAQGLKTEEA